MTDVNGTFRCTFSPAVDLTVHTSTDASPLEDYITFFMRANFDSGSRLRIVLYEDFENNAGSLAYKTLHARDTHEAPSILGIASLLEVQNVVDDVLARNRYAGRTEQDDLNAQITKKDWIIPFYEWQYFAIPKRSFIKQGGFDFTTVSDILITALYLDDSEKYVWLSDLYLVGGGKDDSGATVTPPGGNGDATRGGMQGTYKYRITYLNDTTGNRSNPGEKIGVAKDVNRGYVTLSNLPTSADPQVSHVEIWRTVGNGDRYFKIGQVTNGTATYDDQVADHDILDSRPGVAVMTTLELPLDNDPPLDEFDNCIIDGLTAFWLSNEDGQRGRVFFSPIGRPESLKGFINVTQTGDHLYRLVQHQGIRYVFSESSLYRIGGDDPYVSQKISGVPGVAFAQRRTVVSTPFGIVYQSHDGIRIFSSMQAQLLGFAAIGRLFRGETLENISAFEGIVAAYARNEYFISDGSTCLAIDLTTNTWRNVGFDDLTAIFYEWDTDKIVGGRTSNTQLLEEEGIVLDNGSAIPFEWETPGIEEPGDRILFLDRVFIDIDTGGETVTPTVVHRYTDITLANITDANRIAREFSVEKLLLKPSLRLEGTVSQRVTLYEIEMDIRPLELGVTVAGRSERNAVASVRQTYTGRYREGLGNGEIVFEVPGNRKELDMSDRVYVLDRLTLECNTYTTDLQPFIGLVSGEISLNAATNNARTIEEYEVDRIGNIDYIRLLGDFFTATVAPTVWRLELHMRELELGMTLTTTGQRLAYPARAVLPGTELTFEVPPNRREFDNTGRLFWIERVVVEANTGGTTLTVEFECDGVTFTAGTVNTTTRSYTEIFVQRPGPIRELRILGDFTVDVQVFGVECHVRPVNLGIQTWAQNRFTYDGKVIAPGTEIVFDIDPDRHEIDGTVNVPTVQWLYLDIDTAEADIRPRIVTEFGDIVMTLANTDKRCTLVYDLHEIGNIHQLTLEGDFANNAIGLYGVECILGSLDLGIRILEGGEGGSQ